MRTLLVTLLLICSVSSFAQIDRGTVAIGASGHLRPRLRFNYLSMRLNPSIEYFALKNLSLGYRQHAGFTLTSRYTAYQLRSDAFLRYYVPLSKRLHLFTEVGISYRFEPWIDSESKSAFEGTYAVFGLGMSYFVTPRIAIEGRAYYMRTISELENYGSSIEGKIGVNYYFGR